MPPGSYTKTCGEHSLFMHQENRIYYPTKFGSPTPSRVLKDHLRRICLLNLVIIDHCFYSFVYMCMVAHPYHSILPHGNWNVCDISLSNKISFLVWFQV